MPAMKETTGLVVPLERIKSAASSSAVPPISPIMMIPSVCTRTSDFNFVTAGGPPGSSTGAQHCGSNESLRYMDSFALKHPGWSWTWCPPRLSRHHLLPNGKVAALQSRCGLTCLGVLDEALEAVNKVGAVEGVAADAHDGRLTQALGRRLFRVVRGSRGSHKQDVPKNQAFAFWGRCTGAE